MEEWPNTSDELEEFRRRVYAPREKRKQPVEEMRNRIVDDCERSVALWEGTS